MYWGYIGFFLGTMEKKMENLGPFKGIYRVVWVILGYWEIRWKVLVRI